MSSGLGAAKTWDCEVDDVEWVDGQAQHTGGSETPLSLADIARKWGRTGWPDFGKRVPQRSWRWGGVLHPGLRRGGRSGDR